MENEKRLDLIDRNAIVTLMCRACNNECCEDPCEPGECFMYDTLTNAPTVDAVEVVHGRWVKVDYYPPECSICGDIAPLTCDGEAHYMGNYCPNCGAKMDGGDEDV